MVNVYSKIFSKDYLVNHKEEQKNRFRKNEKIRKLSKLLGYPLWIRELEQK